MSSSKQAKFFCENCDAEVPAQATMCRHCGRFFSSVRCPNCGKTGTNNTFKNGCPRCGYAESKGKDKPSQTKVSVYREERASRKSRRRLASVMDSSPLAPAKSSDALPAWMLAVSFMALVGIIIVINIYILK